jgi:hypothetical protein
MARTINRTSATATSPKSLFHFLFRKSDGIGSGQPRAHRRRRRQQQPAYPTTNTWRELSKSRIQQRPSLIFVARTAIMMVCVSHGSSASAATLSQFLSLIMLGRNATGSSLMARRTYQPSVKKASVIPARTEINNTQRPFGRKQYYNLVLMLIVMYCRFVVVVVSNMTFSYRTHQKWGESVADVNAAAAAHRHGWPIMQASHVDKNNKADTRQYCCCRPWKQ